MLTSCPGDNTPRLIPSCLSTRHSSSNLISATAPADHKMSINRKSDKVLCKTQDVSFPLLARARCVQSHVLKLIIFDDDPERLGSIFVPSSSCCNNFAFFFAAFKILEGKRRREGSNDLCSLRFFCVLLVILDSIGQSRGNLKERPKHCNYVSFSGTEEPSPVTYGLLSDRSGNRFVSSSERD